MKWLLSNDIDGGNYMNSNRIDYLDCNNWVLVALKSEVTLIADESVGSLETDTQIVDFIQTLYHLI
jgi:hypothetical protein